MTESVSLLLLLLPGFLLEEVCRFLVPIERGSGAQARVLSALAWALPVAAIDQILAICWHYDPYFNFIDATMSWSLLRASLIGVVLGVVRALAMNNDWPNRVLRKHPFKRLNLTAETALSEWSHAINNANQSKRLYMSILHLRNGQRVFGFPRLYPSSPRDGHFEIVNPKFNTGPLSDSGDEFEWEPIDSQEPANSILIPITEVMAAELVFEISRSR